MIEEMKKKILFLEAQKEKIIAEVNATIGAINILKSLIQEKEKEDEQPKPTP